ncbi:hypothetical protein AAMO2058_001261300 [Amorphochlora amoebiformis]
MKAATIVACFALLLAISQARQQELSPSAKSESTSGSDKAYPNLQGHLTPPVPQRWIDHFPAKINTTEKKTPNGPGYKCKGCKSPKPQWAVAAYDSGVLPVPSNPCKDPLETSANFKSTHPCKSELKSADKSETA